MIRCVLIVNEEGEPRLVRFYDQTRIGAEQHMVVKLAYDLLKNRNSDCCFLKTSKIDGTLIYRHYASLYFIVIADECESELGILDLLQVFVHILNNCFENICELDIVYHYDRVNYVLDEMVMAGMVLETNTEVLLSTLADLNAVRYLCLP